MSSKFIDVSQSVLSGIDCLKKEGIKAVGRYYNYGAGTKVLTREEATALVKANIAIWTVFEFWNNAPKWFNADFGRKDAVRALQCAQEIVGQPEGTTIYFAADYDEPGSNYETRIIPYFRAIRETFRRSDGSFPYRIGVYSNGLVCRRLLEDGLVDDTWLSCSRGFVEHAKFYASKKWSISQTCGTPKVCNFDSDDDEVDSADFGQFSTLVALRSSHVSALAAELNDEFIRNANVADNTDTSFAEINEAIAIRPAVSLGWRPDLPDHRDFRYGVMRAPLEQPPSLPSKIDLRPQFPPVYDQGDLNSCTANAIGGMFQFDRIKQELPDFVPSRLFIWYNERELEGTINQNVGAYLRDGIKTIASQGVCKEAEWPYDVEKYQIKPLDDCYAQALKYEALSYYRLDNSKLDELKTCLAAGYPFVFGFSIYNSFFKSVGGIIPMPVNEPVLGGHAVVAVGYDDTAARFIIRNSWGPAQGDGGYYYMPYAYLTSPYLCDDFWTVRSVSMAAFKAVGR